MKPLSPDQLYRACTADELSFASMDELEGLEGLVGQDRALEAIRFGIGIRRKGFNLFALGPSGTGKHTMIDEMLRRQAAAEARAADWCYVNNFGEAQKPRALRLPAGRAVPLRDAMKRLIDELKAALPAAFESDEYRARREVIDEQFKQRHEQAFEGLQQRAQAQNVALIRTPMGLALAPVREGEVLSPEAFRHLAPAEQEAVKTALEKLQQDLEEIVRKVPQWEREHRDEVRKLNRDVTGLAVGHLIDELRRDWQDLPKVTEYLDAVEQDILEHAEDFLAQPGAAPEAAVGPLLNHVAAEPRSFRRYQVNVLVEQIGRDGAPVVYEDHPTHQMLVGRAEHMARFGALFTDFNLLRAGALHRANGGYLILDARKLLTSPFAWESLKRALRAGEVRIESLEQMLSLASTISLEPEPIPLDVKVVLVGEPFLHYLLSALDPDFSELFKVAADFDDRIERKPENTRLYARLIASAVRRHGLRPLDAPGMRRVIEHLARLAGDGEKLSSHMGSLTDLLSEADHRAGEAGKTAISAADVQVAIDAQQRRADRVYRRLQEEIARGTIRVETTGERTGQVNGLSVISLGGIMFGQPSRITARVRVGRGEVIDIEREVELGGPLHSKGVLILSGFLGGRFAMQGPLSLTASLVFEQSYGGVEGDSASSAELYALLSALAEAPIRQNYAVTGSVDQRGQVQAIGGVNEKIEGFFDLCRMRGLTGDQGVLIPAANVRHLMLRHDVVEAAAAGKFHIFPIDTIDEGIEILTGVPAGELDHLGRFPPGTINHMVAARLAAFGARAAEAAQRLLPGRRNHGRAKL
jgi:predicted ATP-dependent protease